MIIELFLFICLCKWVTISNMQDSFNAIATSIGTDAAGSIPPTASSGKSGWSSNRSSDEFGYELDVACGSRKRSDKFESID